jgi:hypothetical protein
MTNIVPNPINATTDKIIPMISSRLMIQLFLSKNVNRAINTPTDKTDIMETKIITIAT